jgi:hypothetical protein
VTTRWSQLGPAPARPSDVKPENSLVVGEKKVIFQTQSVEGVSVEGSYYKEISNQNKIEFVTSKWSEGFPARLKTQIFWMKRGRGRILAKFLKYHPDYREKEFHSEPELVLRKGELLWKLVRSTSEGRLIGIYVNDLAEIRESRFLGSSLENAAATLFPDGPLLSPLQKVWLSNLNDNRTLVSPDIRVLTQSNVIAIADNAQFVFPVEDRRFEQVQVYFYLSKVLSWVKDRWKMDLPFILEAETSIGYPEKTNTAFYYQHRIRLGDGDDVVFSRIALDPSIVSHEGFHAVIDAVAKLPFEGEGGSVNEAYADYLTAAMTGNPNLGETSYKKAPYKRSVKNDFHFPDRNGGLYHDAGIVSGLWWSIQEAIGKEMALNLAWQVLLRLNPDTDFKSFHGELTEILTEQSPETVRKVKLVLENRGWPQ